MIEFQKRGTNLETHPVPPHHTVDLVQYSAFCLHNTELSWVSRMCGEPLAVDDNVKDLELVGMNLPVNSSALIFLLCVSQ